MRLERFTRQGQEAIQIAGELAERSQHPEIEPEHVLLALLTQPEGIARPILSKLGANVDTVLNELQAALNRRPKVQGVQRYLSPRFNQITAEADKQARAMQDEYISADHLLLAMAAEKDGKEGSAGQILRQHGATRDELLKVIEQMR